MQTPTTSKVCLASAATLVLGAWLGGNPFLSGEGPPGAEDSGSRSPQPLVSGVGLPRRAAVAGDRAAAGVGTQGDELCPAPELRDHVLHVLRGPDGELLWALRDGRYAMRNAAARAGEPAVRFVSAPEGHAAGVVPAVWQRIAPVKPEGE
jgi:hypothetical protein